MNFVVVSLIVSNYFLMLLFVITNNDDPITKVNPDKDRCSEKVETDSDDEDDDVIIIRKPKPFRYALRSLGPPPDVNT